MHSGWSCGGCVVVDDEEDENSDEPPPSLWMVADDSPPLDPRLVYIRAFGVDDSGALPSPLLWALYVISGLASLECVSDKLPP